MIWVCGVFYCYYDCVVVLWLVYLDEVGFFELLFVEVWIVCLFLLVIGMFEVWEFDVLFFLVLV